MVLAIWLYLLVARGGFWQAAEREEGGPAGNAPDSKRWPSISAVIPARDEAEGIDGTAQIALKAAETIGAGHRLTVLPGQSLPGGWTGKLWAQHQGVEFANAKPEPPDLVLLTDADIVYAPEVLTSLVGRAQAGGYGLTSLMVKLRCKSFAERLFIPAFIFFFQMLYPFAWVNNPKRATAGAAGGCMLVRRDVLREAGGMAAIRDALIDDCALGKNLKSFGPIWLGLTERVHSIRAYPAIADIRRMVARTAYVQLRYSPLSLAGTVVGLALTYLAPVALTFFAAGLAQYLGLVTWLMMAFAFKPTLRLYRMSALWGLALPAIAAIYMAFTLDSAYQHARGRGGMWKGRAQANASESNASESNASESNVSELR